MGVRHLPAFPVVREFLRANMQGRQHGPAVAFLWRLSLALLATVATVGLATMGQYFSTAPAWISITLEPLSLLLMPGFAVALVTAGLHDLDPSLIVQVSIVFYLIFFYALLTWRSRRKAR